MGCSNHFTRRELLIVCTLASVKFACSFCASLQAPFYPQKAEEKGATAIEYGLVFGVFDLVAFISYPIFGKFIGILGAKRLLNGGIVTIGTCSILFGMLNMVDSREWFIGLSFVIRIFESLGRSATIIASFSITAFVFPGSIATMFATLEIFVGLGYILGPTVGGYLYEVGGFQCPFTVVGVLLLLVGLLVFFAIPKIGEGSQIDRSPAKIVSVLKMTPVMFDMCSGIITFISLGFYDATLEPHIRQFNLSPTAVGGVFVIVSGTYMFIAPSVGKLCDSYVDPKKVTAVGSLLVIISFLLVGPAPFMPFDTTFWVVCVGLVFEGVGSSCLVIASFTDAITSVIAAGLPDDITTYGIVSGLLFSAFCLGGFIGPSMAGFLYSTVGFQKGSLFVIAVSGALFICMIWYLASGRRPIYSHAPSHVPENDPLHPETSHLRQKATSSEDLPVVC